MKKPGASIDSSNKINFLRLIGGRTRAILPKIGVDKFHRARPVFSELWVKPWQVLLATLRSVDDYHVVLPVHCTWGGQEFLRSRIPNGHIIKSRQIILSSCFCLLFSREWNACRRHVAPVCTTNGTVMQGAAKANARKAETQTDHLHRLPRLVQSCVAMPSTRQGAPMPAATTANGGK